MKIGRHLLGFQHHHGIGAQEMIEGVAYLVRREDFFQVEMRYLSQGMDPGIGAPRARDRDPFAG